MTVFGAALGLSVSYFTGAADLREQGVEIRHMRDAMFPQLRKDLEGERNRTDARIFEVAGLVKTVLDMNKEREKTTQELIHLLRVQNDLMARQQHIRTP